MYPDIRAATCSSLWPHCKLTVLSACVSASSAVSKLRQIVVVPRQQIVARRQFVASVEETLECCDVEPYHHCTVYII